MTDTTTARPNTYAGICTMCGTKVAAGAGLLGGKVNGRWTVRHTDCEQPTTTTRNGVTWTEGLTYRPARRERWIDREHSRLAWAEYGIDE